MTRSFDRLLDRAAAGYLLLMGQPLRRLAAGTASGADKVLYAAALCLIAACPLFLAAVVEFLLPSFLRFLALAWVVASFFVLAAVDLRARRFLAG